MAHTLDGLMKWLRRDEWREGFEETLVRHCEPACRAAGISLEEMPSVLGEHVFMTVWGCAFEDFLSRGLDDGRNMVDDYLKRRGWKESATNRSYMAALRSSVMSLYEVSEVVPGRSFKARDLVRGGDPILVSERSGTRSLKQWDRIGARIVKVGPNHLIGGGVLNFRFEAAERLLGMLRNIGSMTGPELQATIKKKVGRDIDQDAVAMMLDEATRLRLTAPLFSTAWLHDALQQALNPTLPELRNTDGDEIRPSAVRWPLAPSAESRDIEARLDAVAVLRKESATFWNWVRAADAAPDGRGHRAKATGQIYSVTLDDGATVLGSVELEGRSVLLTANSVERAERGRELIGRALGTLVQAPVLETETQDQIAAETGPPESPEQDALDLSAEQKTEIVHAMLDDHYRKALDQPVGMLDDETPRQAAKSAEGRARLVAWLKFLENSAAQRGDPNDPLATYDLRWLWEELGIADQRR